LFCVLFLLFEIDRKSIVEKLGVSRLTVKKYSALLELGGFAGTLWSRVRCSVKTACGRSRYNVLGALNFCGKKVTTVTNDTYISAEQVVALVLDNAAYQRCGKVTEYAKEHGIGLIFLPPYSPNLNLIDDGVSGSKGKYKKETDSLISENVQLFTDVFIPAA
jgi:hypothetical protein